MCVFSSTVGREKTTTTDMNERVDCHSHLERSVSSYSILLFIVDVITRFSNCIPLARTRNVLANLALIILR